ncbi:MAG TPA: tetratricopeptide repeat protein [Thermoanaerobaculia bacterium]|jgi:hypothetical protein|nr:tetratricopeptide repeat protein [Thermoanaerobaculia bacterium]
MRLSVLLLAAVFVLSGAMAGPSSAFAADSGDALVTFAEGVEAYEGGDFGVAVERLGEAVRLAPEDGSARYWLGLALLQTGKADEAVREIEAALAAPEPPAVEPAEVKATLAKARAAAQGGPNAAAPEVPIPTWSGFDIVYDRRTGLSGSLEIAATADSNPNLLSRETILPDGSGGTISGRSKDKVGDLDLRLAYVPAATPGGWTVGLGLDAGTSKYQDFGALDQATASGRVSLARGADPRGYLLGPLGPAETPFGGARTSFLVQAGGSAVWLDGDSYLRSADAGLGLTLREGNATATSIDFGYSDRTFSGASKGRSGNDLSAGLHQTFFLGRADRSLRLGATAMTRSAGRRFASERRTAEIALGLPFGARCGLSLSGSYLNERFDHPESNLFSPFGPPREDDTARGAAAFTWSLSAKLRLAVRAAFSRRTSNVDLGSGLPDLDYRRTELGLSAAWTF